MSRQISTTALEAMASDGNRLVELALEQRRVIATLRGDVPDNCMLERQVLDLTHENGRLKRKIAELESLTRRGEA